MNKQGAERILFELVAILCISSVFSVNTCYYCLVDDPTCSDPQYSDSWPQDDCSFLTEEKSQCYTLWLDLPTERNFSLRGCVGNPMRESCQQMIDFVTPYLPEGASVGCETCQEDNCNNY